jgi:hypothetical protein
MSRDNREYAAVFTHRALGPMVQLTVADGYRFNLTFQEAQTLARALAAVKDKRSSIDEVYLSPMASDGDFHAKVRPEGLVIDATNPPLVLDWIEVGAIADALAAAAPENAAWAPPTRDC